MRTVKKILQLLLSFMLLSALLIPQTAVFASAEEADAEAGTEVITEVQEADAEAGSEVITEVQEADAEAGSEMTAETQISGLDFSTRRIMVGTGDESIFADQAPVLSSYHGVYLLQFEDEESAKEAYAYYLDKADFVEVDREIMIADETAAEDTMPSAMTEEDNPFSEVENVPALNDSFDVALIDSGASDVSAAISLVGDITDDENGHGTKMAGLIREQNPDAKILSIRVLNADGHGDVSAVYAAMEYAMEQNVKIINLSMSAVASADSEIIRQAVQRAGEQGITVVGAAGNNGNDVRFFVPGSIEPAMIVGAANEDGSKKTFSNYGETVDYYVAADATSEAAAKMSGFLSGNGKEQISGILNQGTFFDPEYVMQHTPYMNSGSAPYSGVPSAEDGMQAAAYGFGSSSLTTKSFDSIKPYLTNYLGLPYVSPCSGLVNWGAKTASGFDCSGYVNAMVHWFYDDGSFDYPYTGEAFASAWWKPALNDAGLWVCGGSSASEIRSQVASGKIKPGDIIVFGDYVHVGIIYEVSGDDAKIIHAYSSQVQINWLASEVWAWDGASFQAAASDFQAAGQGSAAEDFQAAGQGTAAEDFQAAGSGTYFRYDVFRGAGNDGYLKLHKDSANTSITDSNRCYSLGGAVYTVYQGSSAKGTLTTDANGNTGTLQLPVGSYTVKETTSAKGYELDPASYPVAISAGHTSSQPYQLNVKDAPGFDSSEIEIIKKSNSDYARRFPLSGTQFTIRYFDNTDGDDSGEAVRTWCVEIKAHDGDGNIVEEEEPGQEYRYLAKLSEEYLTEDSDELFKDAGKTVIPLGTISVEETKTAPGYTVTGSSVTDGEGREAELIDGKFITTVTMQGGKGKLNFGNLYTVLNTPIEIHTLAVNKADSTHFARAGEPVTIVDTVTMTGTDPERLVNEKGEWDYIKYRLKGYIGLLDADGTPVLDENGEPLRLAEAGTHFVTDHFDGYTETLNYTIEDTSMMEGQTIYVAEYLYRYVTINKGGGEKYDEETLIACEDETVFPDVPDDMKESQRIHFPKVGTTLTANDTSKSFSPAESLELNDEVAIENIVPGNVYVVKGYLVDQTSGRYLKEDGYGSTDKNDALCSEVEFLATEADSKLNVAFKLKADSIDFDIVCFEELYLKGEDGNGNAVYTLVAEHADIDNDAQTVRCTAAAPKTGDSGQALLWMLLTIAGLLGIIIASAVVLRKKYSKQSKL